MQSCLWSWLLGNQINQVDLLEDIHHNFRSFQHCQILPNKNCRSGIQSYFVVFKLSRAIFSSWFDSWQVSVGRALWTFPTMNHSQFFQHLTAPGNIPNCSADSSIYAVYAIKSIWKDLVKPWLVDLRRTSLGMLEMWHGSCSCWNLSNVVNWSTVTIGMPAILHAAILYAMTHLFCQQSSFILRHRSVGSVYVLHGFFG